MAESSVNNSWVDSYLEALLSSGLSTEYSKKPQAPVSAKEQKRVEMVDADRQIYAKYYVSQIMAMDEGGIRDSWNRATSAHGGGERDARLEYLSWRVWFLHRNRKRNLEKLRKKLGKVREEDFDAKPKPTELFSEGEEEEEEAPKPPAEAQPAAKPSPLPPVVTKRKSESGGKAEGAAGPAGGMQLSASQRFLQQATSPTALEGETADPFEGRVDGLYLVLISLHGLVRGDRMELGKDPDTGGQVKYVVELARALAQHPAVYRVDLMTRLIEDPQVDESYGVPCEQIWAAPDAEEGALGGAYIVRLPCGPRKKYLRKERLWPHIREFADRGISHAKGMLLQLQEAGTPCELYTIHGHYADAGEVACLMASTLGTDLVMTGHSLGRNKLEHLLASGTMSRKEIEETYAISRRIEGEERGLEGALMVVTSTQEEVDKQWSLYDGFDSKLEGVLRVRRQGGRHMPLMNVIPPGLDFSNLKVDLKEDPNAILGTQTSKKIFSKESSTVSPRAPSEGTPKGDSSQESLHGGRLKALFGHTASPSGQRAAPESPLRSPGRGPHRGSQDKGSEDGGAAEEAPEGGQLAPSKGAAGSNLYSHQKEDPPIWQTIFKFLRNPRKPVILAMSRPDAKKNITTLVKAFGENAALREIANLVLIMGNRDNIDGMAGGSKNILTQVLKLVDAHDLYGSVAYPKRHAQSDISDIYRLPHATHGIFINPALQEPFGLTVIEAAAHGVPTVATKNGGPNDIMATLHHGILVDPVNSQEMAEALLRILTNPKLWEEYSHNGVANIMAYSWLSHCKKYLESVEAEKRLLRNKKRFTGRASGQWDHRSFTAARSNLGPEEGRTSSNPTHLQRLMSTPHPQGSGRPSRLRSSGQSLARGEGSAAIPEQGPGRSGRSADDSDVHTQSEDTEHAPGTAAAGRKRFAALVLDEVAQAQALAGVLETLIAARAAARAEDLGLGLVSMESFEDTLKALQGAGVDANKELDWLVCSGGADIWQNRGEAAGGGRKEAGPWAADEAWEQHTDFRWDREAVAKAVMKLVTGAPQDAPASQASATLQGAPTLLRALAVVEHSPQQREPARIHPHQLNLPLDAEAKDLVDLGVKARGKDLVATVVLDKLRRRLRQNGFRAHLTLQMAAGGEGGPAVPHLHVTPMRASRALALRFLAAKYGLDMGDFTVVAVVAGLESEGGSTLVPALTTDLIELVSGLCPVFLLSGGQKPSLGGSDAVALERLAMRISATVFGTRITPLLDDGQIKEGLEKVAKGLPKDEVEYQANPDDDKE